MREHFNVTKEQRLRKINRSPVSHPKVSWAKSVAGTGGSLGTGHLCIPRGRDMEAQLMYFSSGNSQMWSKSDSSVLLVGVGTGTTFGGRNIAASCKVESEYT